MRNNTAIARHTSWYLDNRETFEAGLEVKWHNDLPHPFVLGYKPQGWALDAADSILDWTLSLQEMGLIAVHEKPDGELVATWHRHGPGQMDYYKKELSVQTG